MNSLFSRASLKRSPRTSTRKNTVSVAADIVCSPSRSSILARRKTRPPPLQIIPELSENELDIDVSPTHSPATARPTQFSPQQLQLDSSRITLSAFSFSIDDALLMFSDNAPRSPALSASSSTSGASSEDVLATPGTSDDENGCDFVLPTPSLRPQRISIRPLCITKTRSLIYQEDEDIHSYSEREGEEANVLPFTEVKAATAVAEETGQDFYTREFEDFISLSPVVPSHSFPARRDSLTLTVEVLSTVIEIPAPKPRGRSRHSKPLPLLPPATPPVSSFPSISPLVQTTARTSILRRKHNILPLPNYPPPPPPIESRPLPRMAVPLDIEDCIFPEEDFDIPCGSVVSKQVHDAEEDASIYSQPSLLYTPSTSTRSLPPVIPKTPLSGMCGEVALPRSSTDSDAPRSSIDSTSSFTSSSSSNTPISPFTFPNSLSFEDHEFEATERLRSRWSSSTLASLVVEPPRTGTLLSPFRSVFGSRAHRVPPKKVPPQMPLQPTPSKLPKNMNGCTTTPSPTSTPGKHIRRQRSQSSTSSAGTSTSECEGRDGSPSGLQRKPIPLLMFLRAT